MSGEQKAQQLQSAGAIRDVLAAEAAVRRKVEACRADVAKELAAEQERARDIEQRTSKRLSRLHEGCEQCIEERTAELRARASADAPAAELDEADRRALAVAVEKLAASLIGVDHG